MDGVGPQVFSCGVWLESSSQPVIQGSQSRLSLGRLFSAPVTGTSISGFQVSLVLSLGYVSQKENSWNSLLCYFSGPETPI